MVKWLICLCWVLVLLSSCKKSREKIQPTQEKITESVYASGLVKSKGQYQVFSAANGLVAEVFVTEGDLVKKGDPLIRITNTTAQLNTESAKLAADHSSVNANAERLNEARINIDLARSKMETDALMLQRQRNLWSQQIGTRNDLDQRELAYKSSATAYEAARLRFLDLQKQVNFQAKQSQKSLQISKVVSGDYSIKSETAGKVYAILREKGEMVTTQAPVALIGDATAFILELQVDEYDIGRVRQGQQIMLTMDSYKGQVFEAVVEKINPLMNERSKSFTVEAAFVTQPAILYPNLTCEANMIIQVKEKALTIPRSYLLEGDYVLLANNEKTKVTIGLKDYQKVEIINGLNVNDFILKPDE